MAQQTLLDIAKLNGNDALVGLIEENLTSAPEFGVIPARTIRGTSYRTVIRTAYPSVGFRQANASTTAGKSTFTNKLVETFILSSLLQVDKAVASAYEDGVAAWQAIEASGVMRQSMIEVGSQVFYGTTVDTSGFPGLSEIYDSSIEVDAGGTTASTGSSVYAVKFGSQGVQFVLGNNGTMNLSDWREETLSGVPSYVADLTAWIGLQAVNKNSVGRLKDATEDSGKGVTDSQIAKLIAKFPVGVVPDRLFMSRRSARQLQESRSVTIFTSDSGRTGGRSSMTISAPMPIESNGIPITVTDSLTDTEELS